VIQPKYIERRALRVTQRAGNDLFLLSLSGSELLQVAGISRISRDDGGKLIGYQRAEVKKHVREIARYLDSPDMILAHPLILSFSSSVKFTSSRGQKTSDGLAVAGTIRIPLVNNDGEKPAWIVDGQQRALAIELCKNRSFAVPICAFVADEVDLQRDQFMRINNTRPLPKGLVTELLPEISSPLPANLSIRKIPSALCDLLHRQPTSPFKGLIKRPSASEKGDHLAVVSDTVVIKMIEESLTHTSGCLFPFRNIATGEYDHASIWTVLVVYWTAVKETFPDAWAKPPTQSRLMHGVGIRSMGKLMDRIMASINFQSKDSIDQVRKEIGYVAPLCRWTNGEWDELGGLAWNELQNLHKHLSLISNFLIRAYLERRRQ
jgi:DGQHR domain-containing protein